MKFMSIEGISMVFKNSNKEQMIFKNISFFVEKGDFVCFVGASGCGKTTLLRIMSGLTQPTSGRVIFEGIEVKKPWMEGAFVFQDQDQLLPWKTAKQNVLYPMILKRIKKQEAEKKANKYLSMVGLNIDNDSMKYPHQLSAGMKQRVAIARALAMQPEILFMDEPFSSVDKHTRDTLHSDLIDLWRELKITIIFITHDIDEAIRLSNRIIVLGNKFNGIIGDYTNSVKGNRFPTNKGYSELWEQLYIGICGNE
ncbi:nitrate ABC transporter ATP-binding protein [Clostridia bacterium]|nr:nitrate ABC transporter ATP-binding protein [Clostridia bacterium]